MASQEQLIVSLERVSVARLLHDLRRWRWSARLQVQSPSGTGELWVVAGSVEWARLGERCGDEALTALLSLSRGLCRVVGRRLRALRLDAPALSRSSGSRGGRTLPGDEPRRLRRPGRDRGRRISAHARGGDTTRTVRRRPMRAP